MNYYWKPETPEEKAEHRRMQKEWNDTQDASKEKHYRSNSNQKLIIAFIIGIVFLFICFKEYDNKPVSKQVHIYLQQDKLVTQNAKTVIDAILKDYEEDYSIDYNRHSASIAKLINEIESLYALSISKLSPLNEYEPVCEAYWKIVHEFLCDIQVSQYIHIEKYNQFIVKLNNAESKDNCLLQLLEQYGYYYSVSNDSIYYKAQKSHVK